MIPALAVTAFEVGADLVRVALDLWATRSADEKQAIDRLRAKIDESILRLTASLDRIEAARRAADDVVAKLKREHDARPIRTIVHPSPAGTSAGNEPKE